MVLACVVCLGAAPGLPRGVHALARLEHELALPARFLFVGVLWPGDFWIPFINYPAEAGDAVQCGRALARYANAHLTAASDLSFISHSLGGRLVLEAVRQLGRRAREVCLLAAAVDDNCLSTRQYQLARQNAARISVLASRGDTVLRLAYPFGDFFSDVFYDDDSPSRAALGYHGPRPRLGPETVHAQIPGKRYGHGDYLPPADLAERIALQAQPIRWIAEALQGRTHAWP